MNELLAHLREITCTPRCTHQKKLNLAGRIRRYTKHLKEYHTQINHNAHIRAPLTLCEQAKAGAFSERSNEELSGDKLFNEIMRTTTRFRNPMQEAEDAQDSYITLRADQNIMLAHCMGALLPLIYRDKLEANRKRLLTKLHLQSIRQEMVILASRRVGKTWLIAILLAALLIAMPKVEIVCFSLGMRTSQLMMRLVVDMLKRYEGAPKIIKQTTDMLQLQGPAESLVKQLQAFPDRAHVSAFFCWCIDIFCIFSVFSRCVCVQKSFLCTNENQYGKRRT